MTRSLSKVIFFLNELLVKKILTLCRIVHLFEEKVVFYQPSNVSIFQKIGHMVKKSWAFIEKKLMTSQLAIVTMIFFVTMSRPCVRYCVILLRNADDRWQPRQSSNERKLLISVCFSLAVAPITCLAGLLVYGDSFAIHQLRQRRSDFTRVRLFL